MILNIRHNSVPIAHIEFSDNKAIIVSEDVNVRRKLEFALLEVSRNLGLDLKEDAKDNNTWSYIGIPFAKFELAALRSTLFREYGYEILTQNG